MFYEVRATLFFELEDEATDFFQDCQLALPKSQVINPHSLNQECGVIERLDNHHDVDPHQPCVLTAHEDNCPLL